jgi:hypothetical protein
MRLRFIILLVISCFSFPAWSASLDELISGTWTISEFRTAGIYTGGVEETANQLLGETITVKDDGIYLPEGVVCQRTDVIEEDLEDPDFRWDWFGSGGGSFSELGITDSEVVIVETDCWSQSDLLLGDLWVADGGALIFITIEGQWLLLTKSLTLSEGDVPFYGTCNYLPEPLETFGGLPLTANTRYDDTKLGVMVRYSGNKKKISFFRFNFAHDVIDDAIGDAHFEKAVQDIHQAA